LVAKSEGQTPIMPKPARLSHPDTIISNILFCNEEKARNVQGSIVELGETMGFSFPVAMATFV
jgi:hypothetical protein